MAYTFVGTPEYIAPEIISCEGHSTAADWWSLGVLLFELLVGIPPFYHPSINVMFERIKDKDVVFPRENPISEEAVDLIKKFLCKKA